MSDHFQICNELNRRYDTELSPEMVDGTNYENQQVLGRLFLNFQTLWKLKDQFELYSQTKLGELEYTGVHNSETNSKYQ